jgi:hypothetical protein
MCQIVSRRDRDQACERLLQLRVPLDRFRHCEIVQLVGEHDRSALVERSVVEAVDETLIVAVNGSGRDGWVASVDPPVFRVFLPEDAGQVHGTGDDSNSVVNVAERWTP